LTPSWRLNHAKKKLKKIPMLLIIISFILLAIFSCVLSKKIQAARIQNSASDLSNKTKRVQFSSLVSHYVYCFILWSIIALIAIVFIPAFSKQFIFYQLLLVIIALISLFLATKFFYNRKFNAKNHLEKSLKLVLFLTAGIGIIVTILIMFSILFEAIKFFKLVNISDFLFGLSWNPQMTINDGQEVGNSTFGVIPVFLGTLLITVIAMLISIPFGIMSAIYLSEYARPKTRDLLKPIIEILAGVPTVVYGYFAAIVVAPFFKNFFSHFGLEVASESALAAGFVMGIMIIPFILSLSDDALNAVPSSLKDAALALGSTKSEMIKKIALKTATPAIIGAIILAVSRAIGETMIVTMAAGLVAKLTINPFNSVTTATAQIVSLLVGDQEFGSEKTLAAFALALVLFVLTLLFNIVALIISKRYKQKYG
jgi:phosphate transport system permease protein